MIDEIKLLNIHNRRRSILKSSAAYVGSQKEASIIMEIEDIEAQIAELREELKRKLQLFKEQEAIFGLHTDPSIIIQIEDIEGYFRANP